MEIKINIEDYLSKEEITNECRYMLRDVIRTKYKQESEIDRLITNLGYEFIFKAISETLNEDAEIMIKDKVIELLKKDGTIKCELFREKDVWDRSEAVGLTILHNALKENEGLIKEKVQQAIKDYDFGSREDLQCRIEDVFHEILEEKLFHNNEEQ